MEANHFEIVSTLLFATLRALELTAAADEESGPENSYKVFVKAKHFTLLFCRLCATETAHHAQDKDV